MGLQHYQINADDNINDDFTSEEESRRKKARHIKAAPEAFHHEPRVMTPDSPRSDVDEHWARLNREYMPDVYEFPPNVENVETDDRLSTADDNQTSTAEVVTQSETEPVLPESVLREPVLPEPVLPEPGAILKSLFETNTNCEDLPVPISMLTQVWPECVIKRNKGGASTLSRATAQGLGLSENDFWRIKMEIHETIVNEIWPFVREYYKFPLQLYTETGSSVLLDNQYDLFKFLRSTESMQAYNVQLVEILALCNLMGAKLNVLHGKPLPGVLETESCWGWHSYYPPAQHLIKETGRFNCKKTLYYATEDNIHMYLLCTSSGVDVPPPNQDCSSPSEEAVTERELNDVANVREEEIVNEANEREAYIEQFNMVPVSRLAKVIVDTNSNQDLAPSNTDSTEDVHINEDEEDPSHENDPTYEDSHDDNRNADTLGQIVSESSMTRGVSTRSSSSMSTDSEKRRLCIEIPENYEVITDIVRKRVGRSRKRNW